MEKDEIKKELTNLGEPPLEMPKKKDEEKVLVDKKQFDDVMERLANLEKGVVAPEAEAPKEQKMLVKVRFIGGKVVLGYGATYEKRDPDGRKYLMLTVVTEDNVEHQVEYLPFMGQGKFEECEVLDIKKDYLKPVSGKIYQTEYDYKNYKNIVTDKLVDMQVTIPDFKYLVKLNSGREITLTQGALN